MKITNGIEEFLESAAIPFVRTSEQSLAIPLTSPNDNRVIRIYVSEGMGLVRFECSLPFPIRKTRQPKVAQLIGFINKELSSCAMEIDCDTGVVQVCEEVCVGTEWHRENLTTLQHALLAVDKASVVQFERILVAGLSDKPVEELMEWHGANYSCLELAVLMTAPNNRKWSADTSEAFGDLPQGIWDIDEDDLLDIGDEDDSE